MARRGKAKLFKSRKDEDGQFHRGKHGRRGRLARQYKRGVEKSLRQKSRKMCNHSSE